MSIFVLFSDISTSKKTLYALLLIMAWGGLIAPHISHANTSTTSTEAKAVDEALRQALLKSINQSESFDDRFDAEVWLVAMSEKLKRYIKDPKKRFHFLQKIHHFE